MAQGEQQELTEQKVLNMIHDATYNKSILRIVGGLLLSIIVGLAFLCLDFVIANIKDHQEIERRIQGEREKMDKELKEIRNEVREALDLVNEKLGNIEVTVGEINTTLKFVEFQK